MAYPGGSVAIPKPTGWEDIEAVTITRIVNSIETEIEALYEVPYTWSSTDEGAVRTTAATIYTDTLPAELEVGDEVQYRIEDVYSDETILYPADPIVLEEAPVAIQCPVSVRGYGYAKRY